MDDLRNLVCEKRWHGIADLNILFGSIALKKIVVGKCLQARRFPDRQAATLKRVRVDEIMPVLRDMAGDRGRWLAPELNPKSVGELAAFPARRWRRLDVRHSWRADMRLISQQLGCLFLVYGIGAMRITASMRRQPRRMR